VPHLLVHDIKHFDRALQPPLSLQRLSQISAADHKQVPDLQDGYQWVQSDSE